MTYSKREVHHRQRTKSGLLSEAEVRRIKWMLLNGFGRKEIAQIYGMSKWAIAAIDKGDTWNWVEADEGPRGDEPLVPNAADPLDRLGPEMQRKAEASLQRFLSMSQDQPPSGAGAEGTSDTSTEFLSPMEKLQRDIDKRLREAKMLNDGLEELNKGDSK